MEWQLSELNFVSCFVRIALALVLGGIVGVEREKKGRPAGLRTYMLVCSGSALVMMTNQYLAVCYPQVDVSRMASQVISGIGFLGAGTIILTGKNQVRGLTTAAGLWAVACLGLAIGIGFYYGAILGGVSIFLTMGGLQRLDSHLLTKTKEIAVYVELKEHVLMGTFIDELKKQEMGVLNLEIVSDTMQCNCCVAGIFWLQLDKRMPHWQVVERIREIEGVAFVKKLR